MPIYEYKCDDCGRVIDDRREVVWRDEEVPCPDCEAGHFRRIFTPTVNLIVPGHFMLDKDWAMPEKGDPAWENMSPAGARGGIHAQRTPTLRDEFDKVKNWG